MSNSQEQSLDEDVVFPQVSESSAGFLYCEKERQAVERLLSAGPEAFYGSVGAERSGCFLSPEEVSQLSSWAQDYRFNQLHVEREAPGVSSGTEDARSTYFPHQSDTPAPDLDLGWPQKCPWGQDGSVSVYTSPPAEGEPHIREIIRWHLQKSNHVSDQCRVNDETCYCRIWCKTNRDISQKFSEEKHIRRADSTVKLEDLWEKLPQKIFIKVI